MTAAASTQARLASPVVHAAHVVVRLVVAGVVWMGTDMWAQSRATSSPDDSGLGLGLSVFILVACWLGGIALVDGALFGWRAGLWWLPVLPVWAAIAAGDLGGGFAAILLAIPVGVGVMGGAVLHLAASAMWRPGRQDRSDRAAV